MFLEYDLLYNTIREASVRVRVVKKHLQQHEEQEVLQQMAWQQISKSWSQCGITWRDSETKSREELCNFSRMFGTTCVTSKICAEFTENWCCFKVKLWSLKYLFDFPIVNWQIKTSYHYFSKHTNFCGFKFICVITTPSKFQKYYTTTVSSCLIIKWLTTVI